MVDVAAPDIAGEGAVTVSSPERFGRVRALALVVTVLCVVAAEAMLANPSGRGLGWWLVLGAVLSAVVWQRRLEIVDWREPAGRRWVLAPGWGRRIAGALLVLAGVALWADATRALVASWAHGYERGWLGWLAAAVLASAGLRVMQVPAGPARARLARWEWGALAALVVVGAGYRLLNYNDFPPQTGISQIEELQAGNFGHQFLNGDRARWEFIGQAWLGALSLWLAGPSLLAVRMAYSIVAFLKLIPGYFLFRALAGPVGALAGTALLAVSGWDTIVNRIPGQHDQFVVLCCLALLAGPAVRGAWFVYPWIGLMAGYTIYTYVAYRPLIGLVLAGTAIAALAPQTGSTWRRTIRVVAGTAFVTAMLGTMFVPLLHRLPGPRQFENEYLNGWNRARAIQSYYSPTDNWAEAVRKRFERTVRAVELYFTRGDDNILHNAGGRPLIDPVTSALFLLGMVYCALTWWRGFYGVVLAGFAVTFVGTLVATGNFDVLRCASTVPHVYGLVAVGAGAMWAAVSRVPGRSGRMVAALTITAGIVFGAYWNVRLLHDLWTSPTVRMHYRNDLTYLSTWLRDNGQDRDVVGVVPYNAVVAFIDNDGSWLRGPGVRGRGTWDVGGALARLEQIKGPAVLVVVADAYLRDIVDYLARLLPGVEFRPGPPDPGGRVPLEYALLSNAAAQLGTEAARDLQCRGLRAEFAARDAGGAALATVSAMMPIVERHTWPGAMRDATARYEGRVAKFTATWTGDITIPEPAVLDIEAVGHDGILKAYLDDRPLESFRGVVVPAGVHRLTMAGEFRGEMMSPSARVTWKKGGGEPRLVPFYLLTEPDPACLAGSVRSGAPEPAAPL